MYGKAALATWVGSSGRLREMVAGRLRRERASNGERRPDSEKVSALTKGTLKAFATSIGLGHVWAFDGRKIMV
jgi:hypothetical protein